MTLVPRPFVSGEHCQARRGKGCGFGRRALAGLICTIVAVRMATRLAAIGYATLVFVTEQIMPSIMIRCPILGRPVPTGLTTEQIKFESLSGIKIPLQCPACQKLHQWQQKQAWVQKEE